MNDTQKFIAGLELAAPTTNEPFADYTMFETDTETPSYLNFKGLQSFSSNVSSQTQEDVLNSLLLAQRAATKAFPEDDQVYDWYKMYFNVLQRIGWLLNQKDFTKVAQKSSAFELDKAIFDLLGDLVSAQQIKILMKSVELLKSLGEDDKRLVAFEKNTHSLGRGNFQVGMAEESNGSITVMGSGFVLRSKKKITKILFLKFDKNTIELEFGFYSAELVSSEYAKNREFIKQKLGDSHQFIASLDL
ncbi:MAG: hypothetical protein AB3N14_09515 [Flavobacteriaceae bacterium]